MTVFGLAARWAHLVCELGLVGIFSACLLAGRSDRPTAALWGSRILSLARWLAVAALFTGIATFAYQVVAVSGQTDALLDPAMWLRLLTQSRFGNVWLVRHGLLVLLAALVLLREREESAVDWTVFRLEAWALGAAAGAATAWASHGVAAEPLGPVAVLADAVHLVAAGVWLGALLPLALLLRAASSEAGADARPYAVLAARRFSAVALAAMLLIVTTGLWSTWVEVGSAPALVGTRYGRLLLVKIALLGAVLGFAVVNRRRLLPALSGEGATVGRPAMARLSRFVAGELALGLVMIAVAAGLSLTVPAAHDIVWWPFPYRFSYDAVAGLPGTNARLLIGSQIAFMGLVAIFIAPLLARRRGLLIGLAALALWSGLWISLPPLAVDAYPTTYRRSPLPYQAQSIDRGAMLYAAHCAICHGRGGKGDGPGGAGLPRSPADLTAAHTAQHTVGDLFWWITHGIPAAGMPAFGQAVAEDERWDVINFLRALSSGEQARGLTPLVQTNGPRVVAPDFSYAVGPTPPRSLKEFRGRSMALVVFFSLPESRARLEQLARAYPQIEFSGSEIIAVPMDADPGIIARLGATPPILFSVVTEGAEEITASYTLFSRTSESVAPRHAEFLIDRQGYMRARWIPDGDGKGWGDLGVLQAQIRALDQEEAAAPAPDEHVH
jgi:putative copper export protein/mono/diheme cytochrome c family protein